MGLVHTNRACTTAPKVGALNQLIPTQYHTPSTSTCDLLSLSSHRFSHLTTHGSPGAFGSPSGATTYCRPFGYCSRSTFSKATRLKSKWSRSGGGICCTRVISALLLLVWSYQAVYVKYQRMLLVCTSGPMPIFKRAWGSPNSHSSEGPNLGFGAMLGFYGMF
jgi:hypothetical protein